MRVCAFADNGPTATANALSRENYFRVHPFFGHRKLCFAFKFPETDSVDFSFTITIFGEYPVLNIEPQKLNGCYVITPAPIGDSRGYFMRTYDEAIFRDHGLQTSWVQDNQSLSTVVHTVRGLHFQRPPSAETKLVRVIVGSILDVFVDLRNGSPTYGEWDSIELSQENNKTAYIPKGFAHGFCTLTSTVIVAYKVDRPYEPSDEGVLRWNDPDVGIKWPTEAPLISDRDKAAPVLRDLKPIDLERTD
ncbi:MAG: dTDP-4-dehydrorhamnose 3,5-epimerase [Chloroflexi bacterium]|nr:dTDP-4-dehydrorhamnose 3,5-epimerase [Chloroflexota bacterium]